MSIETDSSSSPKKPSSSKPDEALGAPEPLNEASETSNSSELPRKPPHFSSDFLPVLTEQIDIDNTENKTDEVEEIEKIDKEETFNDTEIAKIEETEFLQDAEKIEETDEIEKIETIAATEKVDQINEVEEATEVEKIEEEIEEEIEEIEEIETIKAAEEIKETKETRLDFPNILFPPALVVRPELIEPKNDSNEASKIKGLEPKTHSNLSADLPFKSNEMDSKLAMDFNDVSHVEDRKSDSEFPEMKFGSDNQIDSSLPKSKEIKPVKPRSWFAKCIRFALGFFGVLFALGLSVAALVAVGLVLLYPNLPDISELTQYQPKLPLRIYSSDGALLGEFGEERRTMTAIKDIPPVMKNAVLAIEDARFYQHKGIDYKGVARAALANLMGSSKSQGASTITMQVARNVYLTSEKSYKRKIYEILLTFKMEHSLTKDQILEIYMNQIFLGNRAYGFSAASEIYFGKPLKEISIGEAAMLAGLPKAPTAYNPVNNPERADQRQKYIIERMEENRFITHEEAIEAKKEILNIKINLDNAQDHSEYIAEMVRQMVVAQYGSDAYSRGLNVFTTIETTDQEVAYKALRKGILDYDRRQIYRGPEKSYPLPKKLDDVDEAVDEILTKHPDNGQLLAAVVLTVDPKKVVVSRPSGDKIELTGDALRAISSGLQPKANDNVKIRPGSVIRVIKTSKGAWESIQLPEVEGAFVAINPKTGAIKTLVGGFDFHKNKFNHVTQAWRQPGSSFKPFIYSASLEKGFGPATVINDAPLSLPGGSNGLWEPKNYDGSFEGPMTMRRALARSKNLVTIRILQAVGVTNGQKWITKFGFDAEKHPPYLPMALGAGSVTPMQMVAAYSVFANGGYRINPWLIEKITDQRGKLLVQNQLIPLTEDVRVIDERNAFIMNSLMQEVTKTGTAAKAQAILKRPDLYGKTGTTNDAHDTWFAGFQPNLAAVTWIGYDTPRKLGDRETGGGLSLPIWISYMEHALKKMPVEPLVPPKGVVNLGDWYYAENVRGTAVRSLGVEEKPKPQPAESDNSSDASHSSQSERERIIDIFKNQ